ncbi:MAG: ABC transporter ATP-binding protein [Clostridia bacterium]|nr:ABC transporter ATP-binding protein [Clostridia bacterium]
MIEIKSVTKKYGKFTALNNVSFTVNDNECFALLGFNGAGKTTLINAITTIIPFDDGEILVNGFNVVKNSTEVKSIINISPQEIAVAKNLTVYENLSLICDLYDVKNKQTAIDNVLNDFGLTEKKNALAKKLSGGQLKRLSIALAVITQPKILFLDEPTLGLDVRARQTLWSVIKGLKGKMTLFLTTHYLEEVEELTDRLAIIDKGVVKAVGTKQEVLALANASTIEQAFLTLAEGDGEGENE